MPELVVPTVRLQAAWLDAHLEWGPGSHEDGFGIGASDDVISPAGFETWVRRLLDQSDPAKADAAGRVPCSYRWIVDDGRVVGGIALRHVLNERTAHLGHVGYGIRPSARKAGFATWATAQMLDEARELGLDRVLLVCADDNIASVRTIERLGGVLEGVQETDHGPDRRYRTDARIGRRSQAAERIGT